MADDELTAVRSIRCEISRQCGGDPERVFDYYEDAQRRIKNSGQYEFVAEPVRDATPSVDSAK